MTLSGKRILLTGATGGIGSCVAKEARALGAHLVLLGRSLDRMRAVAGELDISEDDLFEIDFTDLDGVAETAPELKARFGSFDGFVHAAGMEQTKPLRRNKPADYASLFGVNAFFPFHLISALQGKGVWRQGASLVLISSVMGMKGVRGKSVYCASKASVEGFVRAAALELAPQKIRINAVCPAIVRTPMAEGILDGMPEEARLELEQQHPLGFGEPIDVANACTYLLSDAARWITGTSLVIDGGYTL